jgi:hypothetical protein
LASRHDPIDEAICSDRLYRDVKPNIVGQRERVA